jgi:hypothetical protein
MFRSLRLPNLPKFLTFKDIPEPFNHLAKPLVLVSVGLHAALLFAPMPSPPSKTKPVEPKPKTVRVTTLPPIKSKSLTQTKLSSKTLRKPLASSSTNKQLVIPKPTRKAQTQVLNQKPQTTPSVKPAPVDEASSDPSNPMNDFPHYPGAVPGCIGIPSCYETGKSMDVVSQYFQQQLPLKKYALAQAANDADRKVFQFTKGGSQQFLNIFSEGTTSFYLLAPQAMKRSDLQGTVQIPPDFSENVLTQLPPGPDGESTDAPPDLFADPNAFFTKLGGRVSETDATEINPEVNSEIDSMRLVRGQTPQQLLSNVFNPSGYQPKSLAVFGGGQLYELKKGTFKPFYLNLVPAQGGKGTIVVVWRSKPS